MKILFVSHDANRAGAQLFLLNIMRYFQKKKVSVHLLLLDGGALEKDFEQIAQLYHYPKDTHNAPETLSKRWLGKIGMKQASYYQKNKEDLKNKLANEHFDIIYANTIASAPVIPELLSILNAPLITHIHELEFSIQLYSAQSNRITLFQKSACIIACSMAVADNLIKNHGVDSHQVKIIHSFVDNDAVLQRSAQVNKQAIRKKYNIPEGSFLVGGCGNAEWRKGVDVFVSLAKRLLTPNAAEIHFVWVGIRKSGEYYEQIAFDVERMGISEHITFIEPTPEAIELINCFDVFTVVSREDPFPLVMLEAALAERTIFGFEKTGGCSEFIEQDAGQLFDYLDIENMALAILALKDTPNHVFGKIAKEKVLKQYSFENSIVKIEKLLENLA
ncbi:glycosyltransferase family 4 protein [Emticicia sp. TH156]|uniref:glycosyltransferase family 4 protein n=1 Tax=Emticicia sp. TH156 TaxID=2067454 RepID=UPI000C7829E6|nr:glycosyltransferase family 4 protein [Emticicia sp. TH156]PLK43786.1 hypothetical protein C0V77_14870 [Emticicia sp. TH156]